MAIEHNLDDNNEHKDKGTNSKDAIFRYLKNVVDEWKRRRATKRHLQALDDESDKVLKSIDTDLPVSQHSAAKMALEAQKLETDLRNEEKIAGISGEPATFSAKDVGHIVDGFVDQFEMRNITAEDFGTLIRSMQDDLKGDEHLAQALLQKLQALREQLENREMSDELKEELRNLLDQSDEQYGER